jgi:hypothetical protein
MISTRLVQLIETNWEEIARRLIRSIRENPETQNVAARPETETKEWCRDIVENLGHLLLVRKDQETYRRFQVLGGMRFEQNIPLPEAVLRMHILKNRILGFVHDEGLSMTVIQVYAQEELEQRIGQFFDVLVYHVVRGYADATDQVYRKAS